MASMVRGEGPNSSDPSLGSKSSASAGSYGREYECVIYGVANDPETFRAQIHALCDDGCLVVPRVDVQDIVFMRRTSEKSLAAPGGLQELRIRRTTGDQIGKGSKRKVCSSGHVQKLTGCNSDVREEVISYGLYQRQAIKKLDTPVRSVARSSIAGNSSHFLMAMGFQQRYETSYSGERIVTREGIEIEMVRITTGFRSGAFIIPTACTDPATSPLVVNIRISVQNETDIEKTTKRLRGFVNDVAASCSSYEEVSPEHFLPRGMIR
mmetsp:Transcript_3661/g.7124  ORF Transcript_3661/g.7124 Transcript_3661/m.7124 type:complete len:266 (-) Transcript_3661:371-1168(-)